MSYQSFLAKGSALQQKKSNPMKSKKPPKKKQTKQNTITDLKRQFKTMKIRTRCFQVCGTHAFFFPPFFPLEILLFFLKSHKQTNVRSENVGKERKLGGRRQERGTDPTAIVSQLGLRLGFGSREAESERGDENPNLYGLALGRLGFAYKGIGSALYALLCI